MPHSTTNNTNTSLFHHHNTRSTPHLQVVVAHQVNKDALKVEATDEDAQLKEALEGDGLVKLRHLLHQASDCHLLQR